jgi:glutamine amidotransferase
LISIIDYGAGNIESVRKALHYTGCECRVTADKELINSSNGIILPGVGSFGDCVNQITASGLDVTIKENIVNGKPFLGICLGFQMLFSESEESPGAEGLSVFGGKVVRFDESLGNKIPHIGWNNIEFNEQCPLFTGLSQNSYVYFVHSYYVSAADSSIVSAVTEYGETFHSAVWSGNVFATQFHPEKSGSVGITMLRNFTKICKEEI